MNEAEIMLSQDFPYQDLFYQGREKDSLQFKNLALQYKALQKPLQTAVDEVLQSGNYICGPAVEELEAALAAYVGVPHCISCGNGTDALSLALAVWEVGPGQAVFVPDFTFFASAEVVAACGATPVFVDVDPRTYNMDPQDLERKVAQVLAEGRLRPAVVLAVDLFGLPANFPALREVAGRYELYVLEDGAQGFGGQLGTQRACSLGDIATTSFFPTKPLGCYGDGGALFTARADWADKAVSLRFHGRGFDKEDHIRVGRNSRLDTLQAAVLGVKFQALLATEQLAVQEVAEIYTHGLAGRVTTPYVPPGYVSAWAQYTVQLPPHLDREELQWALRDWGIPTRVYYPRPLHSQAAFDTPSRGRGRRKTAGAGFPVDCPVTERLCRRVLSLPIDAYWRAEAHRVVEALQCLI